MPLFVYIILGIALVISLILISRVKLFICYDDHLKVYLKYLCFAYFILPSSNGKVKIQSKKKPKSIDKTPKSNTVITKKAPEKEKDDKPVLTKVVEVKNIVTRIIKVLANRVRFKFINLRVVVACEDAATTALAYAAVSQGIAYIIEYLRNISRVEIADNSSICVESNFISRKSEFEGKIELYTSVFSLLLAGIHFIKDHISEKIKSEENHGTDKTE